MATWRHGRGWYGPLHVEWNVFRDTSLLQVGVWLTGFHLYARWFGLFVTLGDTERERRKWSVSWGWGTLRIGHPWERVNEWRSDDPWWRKAIRLPVVDWLIGRPRHELTKGEPLDVVVPMPEGSYAAVAHHETRTWRRRWYWPVERRESVWLHIPGGGIQHSGKGESGWDCGDDGLCGIGGDSVEDAIANAVRSVLRSRRRYGHDSRGTGRIPIRTIEASNAD